MAKAHISVVELVYHQLHGEQPSSTETRFLRWLSSDEQPYIRHVTVGEEASPLDLGWIENVGMLVVKRPGETVSVPDDAAAVELLHGGEPIALLHAGESLRFQPVDASKLTLRARKGQARVVVEAVPK